MASSRTQETSENKPPQKYLKESNLVKKGDPSVYKLKLKTESETSPKYHLGKENLQITNKVIMMMGASGSGKTTLINGMINYILGVQWGDEFRFKLIDEVTGRNQVESQTSEVMAYVVNHQEGLKIPCSLTFVDTPGFGDTRGREQDKNLVEKIREFFSIPGGIDHIDCVCFVVKASTNRLTAAEKYVFDSVLSIFGKDIKENIQFLTTFADSQTPLVLEAIKTANVPCAKDGKGNPVHFKFNNSALFANNVVGDGESPNFDEMFWKMGMNNMKTYFDSLSKLNAKSLSLTKEVLRERKELETVVQGLLPQIKTALVKLEELKQTEQALDHHQADMAANKDFEYEFTVTVKVKQDLSGAHQYATNCKNCEFTCHYPCRGTWDLLNRFCSAISFFSGKCNICPGKCSVSDHCTQDFLFKDEIRKEKKSYAELKKKYEHTCHGVLTAEEVLRLLSQECIEVRENLIKNIKRASQSLRRLQEIALKPNPLSTPEYIDMLIVSEEEERKLGYQKRIQLLKDVKKEAEDCEEGGSAARGGEDDDERTGGQRKIPLDIQILEQNAGGSSSSE
uniref:Septin-type G domain-containing protein n=1 Tax=Podarcis muralis TaxID=64176 RepID=A0A670JDC9_PODMU